MMKNIRVVLDPPRTHGGVDNPNPTDYLDFTVDFTSEFQYQFFYDLVKDRLVMIDRWVDGEVVEEKCTPPRFPRIKKDVRCEHQYLPDEDGTVYTCGTSDDSLILTEFGWLCDKHRDEP